MCRQLYVYVNCHGGLSNVTAVKVCVHTVMHGGLVILCVSHTSEYINFVCFLSTDL